jgi:Zn-dependent protease
VNPQLLQNLVLWFVPVLLSLTVHEWAHAASADALGDDTARRDGRLTLNPLAHVDPLGTFLMPVLQILSFGAVTFAWAKPVPVNPVRFTRRWTMGTGMTLVSAAGPASNLLLALGAGIGLVLAARFGGTGDEPTAAFLGALFRVNIGLAVFNLLPVPPLDGSKVLHGLLPRRAALAYERIFPYAPVLLVAVFVFGGRFLGVPMGFVASLVWRLGHFIAG